MEGKSLNLTELTQPVFERLGRGLSAFSQIESHLAFLFAQLMEPADHTVSLVAFDAIGLTSPKIRTLEAVAKLKLNDEKLKNLSKILKRVNARTDMRNKLAHWIVTVWHPEMPMKMYDEKTEGRVLPPWWSGKNIDFAPDDSISTKEIDQFILKCSDISTELIKFMTTLKPSNSPL